MPEVCGGVAAVGIRERPGPSVRGLAKRFRADHERQQTIPSSLIRRRGRHRIDIAGEVAERLKATVC